MKKLLVFLAVIAVLTACSQPGEHTQKLTGAEKTLPDELKGLKVYSVAVGELTSVYVGVLEGKTSTSTTWTVNDGETTHNETFILLTANDTVNSRTVKGSILSETDSIIVIQKR